MLHGQINDHLERPGSRLRQRPTSPTDRASPIKALHGASSRQWILEVMTTIRLNGYFLVKVAGSRQ